MHENDEQAFANIQNMIIPHLKIRDSKSPPKAQVDEASLQLAMDKNKECKYQINKITLMIMIKKKTIFIFKKIINFY